MTYPRDLREAPRHVVQQEISRLGDHELRNAISGYGGPKITSHQESILQEELNQRRRQEMLAAELADEARESRLDTASRLEPEPIDALTNDPLDDIGAAPDGSNVDPFEINNSHGSDRQPDSTIETGGISKTEQKALEIVGALLLEAVLIKRTKDTIQAVFNDAEGVHLFDQSIPERITDHLWTEYDAEGRADHLRSILGDDSERAMDTIEQLCSQVGIDV